MAYQRGAIAALVSSRVTGDANGMGTMSTSSAVAGDAVEMGVLRSGVTGGDGGTDNEAIGLCICLKPRQSLNVPSDGEY